MSTMQSIAMPRPTEVAAPKYVVSAEIGFGFEFPFRHSALIRWCKAEDSLACEQLRDFLRMFARQGFKVTEIRVKNLSTGEDIEFAWPERRSA